MEEYLLTEAYYIDVINVVKGSKQKGWRKAKFQISETVLHGFLSAFYGRQRDQD
jgi:DNA-binding transcriptional regulator GbsR (MarR family)